MEASDTCYGSCSVAGLAVTILLVAVLAGPAAATVSDTGQDQPRAEAGVDQDVTRGATILLDATASWSPAGDLESYEWTIESPLNESVEPVCEVDSCRLANFTAPAMGTYEVQLTIEDEAGQTATDTMYVETEAANEFDVSLTGPDSSGDVTLSADVDAGNATLQYLHWATTDGQVANESLSGLGETHELDVTAAPGQTYAVAVQAAGGRVVGDTWTAPLSADGPSRDYPYIEGPTTLEGDAVYDEDRDRYVFHDVDYRVVTRDRAMADEVAWSRDGATIHRGRTYTDTFVAGEHELRATVTYAELGIDFGQFEQVPGDVSRNLGAIFDDGTAEVSVEADPEPQFERAAIENYGDSVNVDFKIEEPRHDLSKVYFTIGETRIKTTTVDSDEVNDDFELEVPDSVSGRSPVTITAVDTSGQEASVTEYIEAGESKNNGRENAKEGGESRDILPICSLIPNLVCH